MSIPFSDRRRFVAGVATGIVGMAVTACTGSLQGAVAGLNPAAGGPRRWDDSWTERLGHYRTVFEVADMDADPGPDAVPAVMDAWHEVHGTSDHDLGFVLVLRHRAVPFFFSDALWAGHDIGHEMKEVDPQTTQPYRRNPRRGLVLQLQQRGVTVLGCNRAVNRLIGKFAEQAKVPVAEMRVQVMDGLMPGVILQPNGLYAMARAQNVGCGVMR